ncbi:uncharacterized protein [Solanum lycopersicum]|uniref:uncharacterized protein n=1 Tax=Solanum lycopersicum TaxID=4081 RepID=UPI003748473F
MDNASSNCNSKIWVFWNSDIDCNILDEDEQQITYYLRRPLWDKLLYHASVNTNPWCAVGDYNVITDVGEKLGGLPYNMRKSLDFIAVIEACGLADIGFSGHKFTWSNKRGINHRVWKRLDRALVNDSWLEKMPQTTITHLPTTGSEHCPLLLEMVSTAADHIKYFRFLNCWVDNPNFMLTVKNCWDRPVKVRMYEEQVHEAEEKYILDQTNSNRSTLHELNAQYIKFLKIEDTILKQKTQLQWFKDGDTNSKYFHSIIRGRRRKLFIHKIVTENGDWIEGENTIAQEACEHFKNIFTGEEKLINEKSLDCIPRMVNQDQNTLLNTVPGLDELKEVVFSMSPNSAAGPDGMNWFFFQKCWNIIKNDLLEVLHAFFSGQMIPKYFSHSCIVLLPKVNNPNKLTEYRPISLSNFTSKIISKLVSNRLSPILPALISSNQSGFVKGRSISENIMLAQEIIHQIKKPNIGSNVIIKLDMAKAYDRVSWSYTCLVLRKMGFDEVFIDMIWRIMANNWYSIIVNGKRYGFFRSSRGLKRGDPLSPALFNLGAEVGKKKQLSYGGKVVLSKHVLQDLPIHLLSAWDNWLGTGPLAQHTTSSNRFNNSIVADFWENGEWKWSKLVRHAPITHLSSILATRIPQQQHRPDQAIWKLNIHGRFDCKSAWDEIRNKKAKNFFNSALWHKFIPFKTSFLLWRTLKGQLPTNEELSNFGIEPLPCFCCFDRAGMDTIEHIFNSGPFATIVWSFFAATAGIQADHSTLPALIKQWWTTKPNNAGHKLLLQATPIFICWNLWKNRCACKYGGKGTNISRIKYAIYKDTFKMLKNAFPSINWPGNLTALIQTSEKCVHNIKVYKVTWFKPPDQWIKINTDGSALTNEGKIGAGGIIRDKEGKMIMAFSTPLGEGSNNQAEIEAALFGLTWAFELGFKNILLDLDSLLVVQWISNKIAPPWNLTNQLERLQQIIIQTQNFRCSHIFREANWVVDALSKHSHNNTAPQVYVHSNQLPKEAHAYYQMDLMDMPSFRRKKTKMFFDPT